MLIVPPFCKPGSASAAPTQESLRDARPDIGMWSCKGVQVELPKSGQWGRGRGNVMLTYNLGASAAECGINLEDTSCHVAEKPYFLQYPWYFLQMTLRLVEGHTAYVSSLVLRLLVKKNAMLYDEKNICLTRILMD